MAEDNIIPEPEKRRNSISSFVSCDSSDCSIKKSNSTNMETEKPARMPQLMDGDSGHGIMEWLLGVRWIKKTTQNERINQIFEILTQNSVSKTLRGEGLSQISQNKQKYFAYFSVEQFCSSVYPDIDEPSPSMWLRPHHSEQLIHLALQNFMTPSRGDINKKTEILQWINEITLRCNLSSIQTDVLINRLWKIADRSSVNEFNEQFLSATSFLLKDYSATVLICPELFDADPWTEQEILDTVLNLINSPGCSVLLNYLIQQLDSQSNEKDDHVKKIFGPLLNHLYINLHNRIMGDLKHSTIAQIQLVLQVPRIAKLLTEESFFLPKSKRQNSQSRDGHLLEVDSFFGRLFRPSPLDWIPIGDEPPGYKTIIEKLLPVQNSTLHVQNPTAVLSSIAKEYFSCIDTCVAIIKMLLKASSESKTAVLKWFAIVLDENRSKATLEGRRSQEALIRVLSAPQMESMVLRFQGLSSTSFCMTVFLILVKLCEPIKKSKIGDLEILYPYMTSQDIIPENSNMLCINNNNKNKNKNINLTLLIDEEPFKAKADRIAKQKAETNVEECTKFPTLIFWLTMKSARVFFYSVLNHIELFIKEISRIQNDPSEKSKGSNQTDLMIQRLLGWESISTSHYFQLSYSHFLSLSSSLFLRAVFSYDSDGNPISGTSDIPGLTEDLIPPSDPSPQFAVFPHDYHEDVMDSLSKFAWLLVSPVFSWPGHLTRQSVEHFVSCLPLKELAAVSLFIMNDGGTYIRNPHLRLSAAIKPLYALGALDTFNAKFESLPVSIRTLISGIVTSFVEAQKAGYYGRLDVRLILTRKLKSLLEIPIYKKALKTYEMTRQEEYSKFVHLFVSNVSWLEEEAVSYLSEIKSRQKKESTNFVAPATGGPRNNNLSNLTSDFRRNRSDGNANDLQNGIQGVPTDEGEEENRNLERAVNEIDGIRNVQEMPIEEVENFCQNLWENANVSLVVFKYLLSLSFKFARDSELLLPHVILSLNCCLHHLLGPKCLELKVANFHKYNFEPRSFLAQIIEIYVTLASEPNEASKFSSSVVSQICSESRFFKPELFTKAEKISAREGLLPAEVRNKFSFFVRCIIIAHSKITEDESLLNSLDVEIPDEYLDPLMSEIMRDPVRLPSSGVIIDRKTIERHLMSDDFDPFNRAPLQKSDLIPDVQLKLKIDSFLDSLKSKKI